MGRGEGAVRCCREGLPPRCAAQRFALEVLRDPTVILPEGAELADEALSVERGTAVRRALNESNPAGLSKKTLASPRPTS